MKSLEIDGGKAFDWGKTSSDYALYRDIYPSSFYELLHFFGIGKEGQKILDIGTGTGVLPINMYKYGGEYTGIDISEEQIKFAKSLSEKKGMTIQWKVCPAEKNGLPDKEFDFITAVQCWIYFDKKKLIPEICRLLKKDGELVIAFMNWLPKEDLITEKSLDLIKKYNPKWQAFNERNPIIVPLWCQGNFRMTTFHSFDVYIPFTYESWNGRIKASRGVGASLSEEEVQAFSNDHLNLLKSITGDNFSVLHEITIMKFRKI